MCMLGEQGQLHGADQKGYTISNAARGSVAGPPESGFTWQSGQMSRQA
jgi:hypothetical protein